MPEAAPHRRRGILAPFAAAVAAVWLALPVSADKLAVFTDGRIMEVEDARLEGDRIVLVLPNEGQMEVAAVRIERVIRAEPAPRSDHPPPSHCDPAWTDQPLPPGTPYAGLIVDAARAADVHPWLLAALVQAESAFDPRALSPVGARGLTQLMPATAADYGVADVWDPGENLRGGAEHLRALLQRFSEVHLALAAYNAGAATVSRAGGVPPYAETRTFVRNVLSVFCPQDQPVSATLDTDANEGGS